MSKQSGSKQSGIFFISNEQGMTRIARTRDLAKRMSEWQAASPSKLRVIAKITTSSSRKCALYDVQMSANSRVGFFSEPTITSDPSEDHVFRELKRHFSDSHVSGDWYSLNASMLLELSIEHSLSKDVVTELISRAALVWQALEYANSKVPSSRELDYKSPERTLLIQKHVIDWLTERSRHNIAVVFQFENQIGLLQSIIDAVTNVPVDESIKHGFWLAWASWMVLQGKASFSSFVDNPTLVPFFKNEDAFCFVKAVFMRLVDFDKDMAGDECYLLYEHFWELRAQGARPEDFTGWDASRLDAIYQRITSYDED